MDLDFYLRFKDGFELKNCIFCLSIIVSLECFLMMINYFVFFEEIYCYGCEVMNKGVIFEDLCK